VKKLDAGAGFVDEAEDGSTVGIFTELADDECVQTVEGFAHVAGFQGEEHAQTAGECQHGRVFERLRISSTTTGIWSRFKASITAPEGKMDADGVGMGGRTLLLPPSGEGGVFQIMQLAESHGGEATAFERIQQSFTLLPSNKETPPAIHGNNC